MATRYYLPTSVHMIPPRNRWGSVCRNCGAVVRSCQGRALRGEPCGKRGRSPWLIFCDPCIMPRVRMGSRP